MMGMHVREGYLPHLGSAGRDQLYSAACAFTRNMIFRFGSYVAFVQLVHYNYKKAASLSASFYNHKK